MTHARLLADDLGRSLSANALKHLRGANVRRHSELMLAPEALRALLMNRGFPAHEAVIELEARAGGAVFPDGSMLGGAWPLQVCPSLRARDLPLFEGTVALPIYGIINDPEEWETPIGVMSTSGTIPLFWAPLGPTPAFASLDHLLEILALAPLSDRLHTVRVDAFCGEVLAGLLDVYPYPPAAGDHARGWVGADVWVKELKVALPDAQGWSSHRGTFICAEDVNLLVDPIRLLLEQGFSLGHRGPVSSRSAGEPPILSFIDRRPADPFSGGPVRVQLRGGEDGLVFSHEPL